MPVPDESRVSFGIFGKDLKPNAISAVLGITPTSSHAMGDKPTNRPTHRKPIQYSQGGWMLDGSLAVGGGIGPQLRMLLDLLYPKAPEILKLGERGYEVLFFCVLFASDEPVGFVLTQEVLRKVSALGAELSFSIHYLEGD
jgi:hypothetical protein